MKHWLQHINLITCSFLNSGHLHALIVSFQFHFELINSLGTVRSEVIAFKWFKRSGRADVVNVSACVCECICIINTHTHVDREKKCCQINQIQFWFIIHNDCSFPQCPLQSRLIIIGGRNWPIPNNLSINSNQSGRFNFAMRIHIGHTNWMKHDCYLFEQMKMFWIFCQNNFELAIRPIYFMLLNSCNISKLLIAMRIWDIKLFLAVSATRRK